jgi:hypothetical protein
MYRELMFVSPVTVADDLDNPDSAMGGGDASGPDEVEFSQRLPAPRIFLEEDGGKRDSNTDSPTPEESDHDHENENETENVPTVDQNIKLCSEAAALAARRLAELKTASSKPTVTPSDSRQTRVAQVSAAIRPVAPQLQSAQSDIRERADSSRSAASSTAFNMFKSAFGATNILQTLRRNRQQNSKRFVAQTSLAEMPICDDPIPAADDLV